MSSDENDNGLPKRKRKVRRLPDDSPASTSSGSPIIGTSSNYRRRHNVMLIKESTDSEMSDDSDVVVKRKRVGKVESEDSDFSSEDYPINARRLNNRPLNVIDSDSENESDSSSSDVVVPRRLGNLNPGVMDFDSDSPTDSSEEGTNKPSTSVLSQEKAIDSDSSDDQSEKCPICLITFRSQAVGIPSSCDHTFCLECIQEWSKNMNTCPVDRKEYLAISTKESLNGKFVKMIPVNRPEPQEEPVDIIEDPTPCEICGLDGNEDRLLLCDGCDLGFHLYCLDPPLEEVPEGSWYCSDCGPDMNRAVDFDEVVALFDDAEDIFGVTLRPSRARRSSRRLIPRTRQTERVRRRVENNRNQRQNITFDQPTPSTSYGRVNSNRVSSTSATPTKKPRKKSKRKSATAYKTVWVLNESGEAVAIKKKVRAKRRKRKGANRGRSRHNKNPLASQLRMCLPRNSAQSLPDGRNLENSAAHGRLRHPSIPSLDLFGSVSRLENYLSEDEGIFNEGEGTGVHTLLAGRTTTESLRRVARRKAAVVNIPTVSSSTDILDSIMDAQEKLLSKRSTFSVVDSSGKIQIDYKQKDPVFLNNNNHSKPDFQSYSVKETPWHGRGYRQNTRGNWSNNRNWQNNRDCQGRHNYSNACGQGSSNNSGNCVQGGDQYYNDAPQDYTQRTLCEAEMLHDDEKEKKVPTSDTDVDIYSDIENETVSTSRIEEYKPSTPPVGHSQPSNTNTDEDNDSESDMVIDTEKGLDDPVSSTVGPTSDSGQTEACYSPGQPTDSPGQPIYSPREPTGSPEQSSEAPPDPQSIVQGYDELQRELASGYDALQQDIALGSDELQRGFASGFQKFQSLISMTQPADDPVRSEAEQNGPENSDKSVTNEPEVAETQEKVIDEDEVSNDGCPNFSIYSRESKSVALTTDISLPSSRNNPEQPETNDPITDESQQSLPATPQVVTVEKTGSDPRLKKHASTSWNLGGLYSDSEDESVVKKTNSFAISDIKDMTEDILSEEERSYTPVLDEKGDKSKEGLEGLDTEMISDDDRNDFDESHELKTVSDGDALEINAKESELEFTRPDDFEEGEIVDKNKDKPVVENEGGTPERKQTKDKSDNKENKDAKKRKKEKAKGKQPSNTDATGKKEGADKETFKKLTKSSRERNYRDKDKNKSKEAVRERSRSKSPDMNEKEREAKKRKEKRKEIERYNVRAIIADKPRKDQFGRDLRRTPSPSRSRSYTPPLVQMSPTRSRRSLSPIRAPTPRRKSRTRTPSRGRRSLSKRRSASKSREKGGKKRARSRSRSGGRKRDRSKTKKRKRSISRSNRGKKSKEKGKKRTRRSQSRRRTRSPMSRSLSPRRSRKDWTPSLSRSLTPPVHHASPSWTPPRTENTNALRNQNLTVIVNNETATKKKKSKRSKDGRRKDEQPSAKRRRRERERTPPPSKEVFASGDNILVSVSFNNENETRDVSTRDNRKRKETASTEQQKRPKEKKNKTKRDLTGVKPVAIIDLERSPFQEIVSSPKDVIILSDSDNNETESRNLQNSVCDSSQQVASPEETSNYLTGPKTPPEPSVKFSLLPKPPQLRAINNPLHDPLETVEEEAQEDLGSSHKGPNTPPEEPPTSPPSSPDAYDPFEPTKSRSPTPEPRNIAGELSEEPNTQEALENKRSSLDSDKGGQTPDVSKSLTPPMPDIQPADSQSSIQEIPDSKSPDDRIGGVASQLTQLTTTKPVGQTIPFSSVQTTIASSTPMSSTVVVSRINVLSAALVTPSATIPQRIVLPNQVKSSPVKIPPTKAAIKSTPIKPMQSKAATNKKPSKQQNGNNLDDANLDFESPYSPGSSDYEDLFEPPSEPPVKPKTASKSKRAAKNLSAFDNLFGSPSYSKKTTNKRTPLKKMGVTSKTKHVGVKVDEDSLKILEELPNSAVEMQVKDKFLKKLNRQERVVEEVKMVLKPFYNKKKITKEEYKDIMRRAVPKICHNKTGEINPIKIRTLIEAYVKKVKHSKKVTSSSSLPQKVV